MTYDTRGRVQQPAAATTTNTTNAQTTPTTSMSTTSLTSPTDENVSGGGGGGDGMPIRPITTDIVIGDESLLGDEHTTVGIRHGSDSGIVTSPVDTCSTASDALVGAMATVAPPSPSMVNTDELIAAFPVTKLASLTQKLSNTRWIVPVLPEQELECLLNAAIELTEAGCDHDSELCMRFYRVGLTMSFQKILTDEAVKTWKPNIQNCILASCGKLLQLCALHMKRDNPYLLDLLAIVLDPENKFHTMNASRLPEMFVHPQHQQSMMDGVDSNVGGDSLWGTLQDVYAVPLPEPRSPKGWLVDLINKFGQMNGFDNLLERFNAGVALLKQTPNSESDTQNTSSSLSSSNESMPLKMSLGGGPMSSSLMLASGDDLTSSNSSNSNNNKLSLPLIHALLRPFGQCYEMLRVSTIERYFMPIWEVVIEILNGLSDEELKREAKPEGRSESINGIVRAIRCLASRLPNQENLIKELEMFRLKIILRLLQVSSFNGKMNALNEINKILSAVSCYPLRAHGLQLIPDDEMDWLTAERMAVWIKESGVLWIALKDSLHQPQYVEKLEKILRFLIKEKALTLSDLDAVWKAQAGKHEAIVKNVHDLLAKLAWDFNAEQLDHLFDCFQTSMTTANKKQRERLLEFIRRLAEDDKNGMMANKVLKLFWTLAHSSEVPPEVLDQALAAHVKILDYSCSQERDAQKSIWLNKCVEELKCNENWQLPALRLIREICCLYEASHQPKPATCLNRHHIIETLQNDHTLVILVTQSLTAYMDRVRVLCRESPQLDPQSLVLDNRYPHALQIQERLDFLKFLLKDGQLWLCADQAEQIWHCLAVEATCVGDREECFRWFGKLMGDEPDLDPGINKAFFENNILQLDPQLLTESGIKCFERFFKAVNSKELKLQAKQRGYVLDDEDLIGKDYLWRVITTSGEDIACKAIELLKEVSTALGPRLQSNVAEFHEKFIGECCERLRDYYENVELLSQISEEAIKKAMECGDINAKRHKEAEKMCRVIRVLYEYIRECDRTFNGDRFQLPLSRAYRGRHMNLYVRLQNTGRQPEEIEMVTHSNETLASFKRNILKRIKNVINMKVELYYGTGEVVEIGDERNPLSQFAFRDKMILTAKLVQQGHGLASSPDSSSDSSTGSPPRPCPNMQRLETEASLPGVLIALKYQYVDFFLQLYQLGANIQHGSLRDCSRLLLQLIPLDRYTVQKLEIMCRNRINEIIFPGQQQQQGCMDSGMSASTNDNSSTSGNSTVVSTSLADQEATLEALFLHSSPARVLYNLEVLHAMLIPALDPLSESNCRLQLVWLHSGVAHFILELLTKNNFLPNADMHTKRAAFQCVLRLAKLFLYIVGYVLSRVGDEPQIAHSEQSRSQVEILKHVLSLIAGSSEQTLRLISMKLAQILAEEMLSEDQEYCRVLFKSALKWSLPDYATIKAIVNLAWAASCGSLHKLNTTTDFSEEVDMPKASDFTVCKEALELLSISLVLNPNANEALNQERIRHNFITSLVLTNPSRDIRHVAAEQLFISCAADRRPSAFMVQFLVVSLQTLVPQHAATCAEFFQLLCRILNYGCMSDWPLLQNDRLLNQEIAWLRAVRDTVQKTGETKVHEDLLEGHLCLTKELLFYLNYEAKAQLNSLIEELINDFLFPASRLYLNQRRATTTDTNLADICASGPPPVCRSGHTIAAASDLLVALCQKSVPNMSMLVNTLVDMFFADTEPLKDWEYLPPVGPRPVKGFVGLKNAGATCYMNSVLQQLYMIQPIRCGILAATGAATDLNEDFSGEVDYIESSVSLDGSRNNYHVGILKHVQAIFAHLGHSALQFYIPKGLWTHFKLQGQPVNLREQQDAVEFFMSLFESLDDGLKELGHPQLMGTTLGGCFSDQKICQGCPHRYSKEEPFSVFSVDIRNHSSLTDSLEQYVKGELLEGADAHHCDKCDKKVVAVKRLCVRKLPPVLAIQLKRFEYDYERVCAIKFNDYFEFPRILDMEPYTVSGLAKIEGEVIEMMDSGTGDEQPSSTKYRLTGIVVHSGQASGGHYFSYIMQRDPNAPDQEKWYKFDDGEVSECKMHEEEEMKAQCFGGDYMGEVYDNNLKRMQFRRQKRWWNAYMLFYTRCDQQPQPTNAGIEQLSLAESRDCVLPMPKAIEKSVRLQNIHFLHSRSLFSSEFFNFIRNCCGPLQREEKLAASHMEELSLLRIKLASQFLFHSGFRTKKNLRGTAIDWYETLSQHIRCSRSARRWFAQNALLNPPGRLGEYILVAPSPEVRTVFVKLVVFTCHWAITDEPVPGHEGSNLCEQILIKVLALLKWEVAENGKHLPHYFSIFSMCSGLDMKNKRQLLKLKVPEIFMRVALDEGPGPPIKYEYPDFSKLHQVVSNLIRCCDLTVRCVSSNDQPILPNPFAEPHPPVPISTEACDYLFARTSYIKKLSEDPNVGEDGIKLLQYCSWENPNFSHLILTELMWQCGYAYWHDLRHYTELLLYILLMEDSWQSHRIHNALLGIKEERDGLLDTIQRSKMHYQKRAYIIIKMLVQLFKSSQTAHDMLKTNPRIVRQWSDAVDWLQEELQKNRGVSGQYNYNSWSPPVSNDNTNGYVLERSQSAKNILQKARDLCPEEEDQLLMDSDVEPFDESGAVHDLQVSDEQESSSARTSITLKSTPSSSATTATTSASSDSRTIIEDHHIHGGGTGTAVLPNLEPVVHGLNQMKISPSDDKSSGRESNNTTITTNSSMEMESVSGVNINNNNNNNVMQSPTTSPSMTMNRSLDASGEQSQTAGSGTIFGPTMTNPNTAGTSNNNSNTSGGSSLPEQ